VPHDLLLKRLFDLDLPHGFILWFKSYLTNRRQFVSTRGISSNIINVTSGVPQGAVLSPSAFCMYMSPLQVLHPCNSLSKYADDMVLSIIHTSEKHDELHCESELANISDWCSRNRILLNQDKSSRMLLAKNEFKPNYPRLSILREDQEITILGIIFSNNFSWSKFINKTITKASSNLYLLRILKPLLNKTELTTVYTSLIQSQLDYGSALYVGSIKLEDREKIKKIQTRGHRIICGPSCNSPCLVDPDERRLNLAFKLFKSALSNNKHILHGITPPFLPSGHRLSIPTHNSHKRASSFLVFLAIYYNNQI
jgi:hypothetical protein